MLHSFHVFCTESYTTITFDHIELLNNGWNGQKFYFKINGTTLSPDKNSHKIKLSSNSLDTLLFSFDSTFQEVQICLTKFKAEETYKIRINPCSQYELIADNNSMTGKVRFKTINNNDIITVKLGSDLIIDTLITDELSQYFQNEPSAMCYFVPTEISFTNRRENEINTKVFFHFLQGEMITVTYNGKTKKVVVTVDGYQK